MEPDFATLTLGEYCGVLGVIVALKKSIPILCVLCKRAVFILASPAPGVH